MNFGLNFFPSFRAADLSAAEYFDQVLRLSERADELGFRSIKTVEHYFHDYGGSTPNPVVLLSAIAARTRQIRLITGAVIPAFHHPVKLAGELAMLDNLCHGRLDVGVGRAFIPRDFEAFGVRMDDSRARFEEGLALTLRLWTEERVTHQGAFHTLRDVHLLPRPVQRPHPPVWVAAIQSRESFVWAGTRGYHLMIVPYAGSMARVADLVGAYRDAWRAAGHPPGDERIQSGLHCYLADSHREAVEGYRAPMRRYLEVFAEAVDSWKDHARVSARPAGGAGGHAGRGRRANPLPSRALRGARAVAPDQFRRPGRGRSAAHARAARHPGDAALLGPSGRRRWCTAVR
jgi:natural product biosynthesis luciferase-like monooxygenase protein